MTDWPGNCAECGRELVGAYRGWVTVDTGFLQPAVRVHTVCRERFLERPLDIRLAKAKEQNT